MRTRVSVTSLLGALALFALANIQRARHSTEPSEIDFVVWDTEQTAWEGSNARRWSGLIPGTQKPETREVLQLSALRATLVPPHDHGTGWALRHGEAFSLLVRPTVNPVRQTNRKHRPPRASARWSAHTASRDLPERPLITRSSRLRMPSGCAHRLQAAPARLHAASLRPHQARNHRSPGRSPLAHAAPSPCASCSRATCAR